MPDPNVIPATAAARAAATREFLASASDDQLAQAVADGAQLYCPETGMLLTAQNIRACRARLWKAQPPQGPRGDAARSRIADYARLIAALTPQPATPAPAASLRARVVPQPATRS